MYEVNHLKEKLKLRDRERVKSLNHVDTPMAHPLFKVVEGDIEKWERIRQ